MIRFLVAAMLFAFPAMAEQDQPWRPILGQAMPFDATSKPVTSAMGAYTRVYRLVCSQSCFVAFGASGTTPFAAAATGLFLPINRPEYFEARANERIAVVRLATDGTLYVMEMNK